MMRTRFSVEVLRGLPVLLLLLAGCDILNFCTSGDYDYPSNRLVGVLALHPDKEVVSLGNFGRPDIFSYRSPVRLSFRQDGTAFLYDGTGEQAVYSREDFSHTAEALPDSLTGCVFAVRQDYLVCAVAQPDTLAVLEAAPYVVRARTGLFALPVPLASSEALFTSQAEWLGEDRYRIVNFASPAFSADGTWMVAWSQTETRELVRNAEREVVREVRYAASAAHLLVFGEDGTLAQTVDLPQELQHLDAGPLPRLAIANTGQRAAVMSADSTFLVDLTQGHVLARFPGAYARFNAPGTGLAVHNKEKALLVVPFGVGAEPTVQQFDATVADVASVPGSTEFVVATRDRIFRFAPGEAQRHEIASFTEAWADNKAARNRVSGEFTGLLAPYDGGGVIHLYTSHEVYVPDPCAE